MSKIKIGDSVIVSSDVMRSYKCRAVVTDLGGIDNQIAHLTITKSNQYNKVGYDTCILIENLTKIKEE